MKEKKYKHIGSHPSAFAKGLLADEVKFEVDEKAFRVDKAICPHCRIKMQKIIENKSLFDGSLTFHIIKLKCEKCNRKYLDLEQADVYDLFLVLDKYFKNKPLENVTERFSERLMAT